MTTAYFFPYKSFTLSTAFLIFFAISFPSLLFAKEIKSETIKVCGDATEWPPYLYYERQKGKKTKQVVGYTKDILDIISKKHGLTFKVEMLPWKRCMKLVETGKYQMVLDASYNEERDKTYLMTRDYYFISPYYFHSKKVHPAGVTIKKSEDFNNYKVCGIFEYNYSNFNFPIERIDRGSKNFESLIKKTHKGWCDILFARFEIVSGFTLLGTNYLKELEYAPVPGSKREKFYMLISRKYKEAKELKKIIDREVTGLEKKGVLPELLKKHKSL